MDKMYKSDSFTLRFCKTGKKIRYNGEKCLIKRGKRFIMTLYERTFSNKSKKGVKYNELF